MQILVCTSSLEPVRPKVEEGILDSQEQDFLDILKELQTADPNVPSKRLATSSAIRMTGYFCSDAVFNLSKRILTDIQTKVLEKGLDFAPIQRKINEPELRQDFADFSRRMHTKSFFRNEPTSQFSTMNKFPPKSTWKPPKAHRKLEVFVSQLENEIFKFLFENLRHSNTSKEESEAIGALTDDLTIVIEKADKNSCLVVWNRTDYLLEAEKRLNDTGTYKNIEFKEKLLTDLVESSYKMFLGLNAKVLISQKKELQYFTYDFKKSTNLGKLYFLPKIHKKVIWDCQ